MASRQFAQVEKPTSGDSLTSPDVGFFYGIQRGVKSVTVFCFFRLRLTGVKPVTVFL